jgi:hypothetical protein
MPPPAPPGVQAIPPPAPPAAAHSGSLRKAGSKPPRTTVGLSTKFATSSRRSPRADSGIAPPASAAAADAPSQIAVRRASRSSVMRSLRGGGEGGTGAPLRVGFQGGGSRCREGRRGRSGLQQHSPKAAKGSPMPPGKPRPPTWPAASRTPRRWPRAARGRPRCAARASTHPRGAGRTRRAARCRRAARAASAWGASRLRAGAGRMPSASLHRQQTAGGATTRPHPWRLRAPHPCRRASACSS